MKPNTISVILSVCFLLTGFSSYAAPMKARTIQPLYAKDAPGLEQSFIWTLEQLKACDSSLDIVVLPEFSEVPGHTSNSDFLKEVEKKGPVLLEACAETARRCSTLVFCGAIDMTEFGPRNTIFVFDRTGKVIGKYLKEHLTRGEWANLGFDKSYTQRWNEPYMLEIEGVRYAFLTCYDFYFYENYSNIARFDPDVIIGSSHQRSDTHLALNIIDAFCAYNTGTYLVRASVSMGEDSPLGGCSCVVAPDGNILANLESRVGVADVVFDPMKKYLKPAGYGNPPAKHCQYIEIGRRPWKYRPGGSAITLPIAEASEKRICTLKGFSDIAAENPLAAYGAAVAEGASEIGITVNRGEELSFLKQVLQKFSCHTIMKIDVADKSIVPEIWKAVVDYDACGYVYFSSADTDVIAAIKAAAPSTPVCIVLGDKPLEAASAAGCSMISVPASRIDGDLVAKAHSLNLRCLALCRNSKEAAAAAEKGADTIVSDDYPSVAKACGWK